MKINERREKEAHFVPSIPLSALAGLHDLPIRRLGNIGRLLLGSQGVPGKIFRGFGVEATLTTEFLVLGMNLALRRKGKMYLPPVHITPSLNGRMEAKGENKQYDEMQANKTWAFIWHATQVTKVPVLFVADPVLLKTVLTASGLLPSPELIGDEWEYLSCRL